jgi:hypothetical protein
MERLCETQLTLQRRATTVTNQDHALRVAYSFLLSNVLYYQRQLDQSRPLPRQPFYSNSHF